MKEVVYLGNIPEIANAISQTEGYALKAVLIEDEADRELFPEIEAVNIPIYRIPDKKVLSAALESFAPFDVGVIANFGLILSQEDIECAEMGFVNAHPGLLPVNKGRYPVRHCLLEKHTETAMTLHRVTPRVDEGEVLQESRISISGDETLETLCRKLYSLAPSMIQQYLQKMSLSLPI